MTGSFLQEHYELLKANKKRKYSVSNPLSGTPGQNPKHSLATPHPAAVSVILRLLRCLRCVRKLSMKILSFSADQELSHLRRTILEAAGHQVLALTSEKEAVKEAQSPEHYDVVLLCHRLPAATARQMVRLVRQGHPDTRIIYIVHVYGEWPEVEADRYVVGADGPEALARVLEEVQV